jgi:small conductance mechanosensitive channel
MMTDLGTSSVNWTVRAWVSSADFFVAREQLTVEVKRHLDAAGITIPFPQMDVHLVRQPEADEDRLSTRRQRPRLRTMAREFGREVA